MPRPHKPRMVGGGPAATVFKPAGTPAWELEQVVLALDEFEALSLVDGQGLEHEQAAQLMGVSRPTVTRIVASGRNKLATMLTRPAALVIEGGRVCQRQPRGEPCPGRGHGNARGRGEGRGRSGGRCPGQPGTTDPVVDGNH